MIPSAQNHSRSAETLMYTLSLALVQKVGPVIASFVCRLHRKAERPLGRELPQFVIG